MCHQALPCDPCRLLHKWDRWGITPGGLHRSRVSIMGHTTQTDSLSL
jgi:hypothetical protein